MPQAQVNLKSVFIQAERMRERHYCHKCLYGGPDKHLLMGAIPKPSKTKCLIGSSGYYVGSEIRKP